MMRQFCCHPVAPPPAHIYLPTPGTRRSNPMDMHGYSRCRIYVLRSTENASIDLVIKGAPNEYGPYLQELGEQASQCDVTSDLSFVLRDISRYLVIEIPRLTGSWTIWAVPIHA
ncbi:hypothetical protein [Cohnella sp.]|uniref:hypothetical protein n=1 Tax=Cohnella sp. TaxID=1883426 RepID=UPI0035669B28